MDIQFWRTLSGEYAILHLLNNMILLILAYQNSNFFDIK